MGEEVTVTGIQVTGTILTVPRGVIGAHSEEEHLQDIEVGGAGVEAFPAARWVTPVVQESIAGAQLAAAPQLLRE